MTTIKKIRNRFGNYICRGCINEVYHTELSPKECEYQMYPDLCPRCKAMKNIVCGTTFRGKIKLAFRIHDVTLPERQTVKKTII